MNNLESMAGDFVLHFTLWVFIFIGFCAVVGMLALAITTVWYFLEEGYKELKDWRIKKHEGK